MGRWLLVAVIILVSVGVFWGVKLTNGLANFWAYFWPGLWSSVIGVTVAAIISCFIGFTVNHYFVGLSERKNHKQKVIKVKNMLTNVRQEVDGHQLNLQALGQLFPPSLGQDAILGRQIRPTDIIGHMLQDSSGRQFLADRSPFEIDEALISFEVANYYSRVGELNRELQLRSQQSLQPEIWDEPIRMHVRLIWSTRLQIDLEIGGAIDRLEKSTRI